MFESTNDTTLLENPLTIAALLGLFLYLIITGSVFFKWQIDKMFEDKDKIIETQAALIKWLEAKVEELRGTDSRDRETDDSN